MLTRRHALSVVASAALLVPAAPAANHPDAALLAAWAGFIRASRTFEHAREALLPNGGTDADHKPYYQAIGLYRDQIERHQASTIEGFAIQLRYLFAHKMGCMASFNAAIYGDPVDENLAAELNEEYLDKMLWNMVQAANRAGQMSILTDQSSGVVPC